MHALVVDLGYRLIRSHGGHLVYEHDEQERLTLPATPSDWRARANDLAEIKRRHPDAFARQRSERRLTKKQRAARATRRASRAPMRLVVQTADEPITVTEVIPTPGSLEAVADGCICPVYGNNHGEGIDGCPGVFEMVLGCPLHGDDLTPAAVGTSSPVDSQARCKCGQPIPRSRRGRPRKWCESCRPSQWKRMSENQRDESRKAVRRWYHGNRKEAS